VIYLQGGFKKGERTSSLLYILYTIAVVQCTSIELFQRSVVPLVLKFDIHQEQAGRKGVRRGEKEGKSGRVESRCS
jgi:hypothetical protein